MAGIAKHGPDHSIDPADAEFLRFARGLLA